MAEDKKGMPVWIQVMFTVLAVALFYLAGYFFLFAKHNGWIPGLKPADSQAVEEQTQENLITPSVTPEPGT